MKPFKNAKEGDCLKALFCIPGQTEIFYADYLIKSISNNDIRGILFDGVVTDAHYHHQSLKDVGETRTMYFDSHQYRYGFEDNETSVWILEPTEEEIKQWGSKLLSRELLKSNKSIRRRFRPYRKKKVS